MQGEIKKLVANRGFGFIRLSGGKDVFFHRSDMADGDFDLLFEGQTVAFDVEESRRGPRARHVRPVS